MQSPDTPPEVSRRLSQIYASMSGAEKVAHAMQMATEARLIAMAGIRSRHPEWSESQITDEWIRLLHGDEIAARVTQWRSRS